MIESLPLVAEVVMGVMGCILNSECEICYSQNARPGSSGFSPVFIFNLMCVFVLRKVVSNWKDQIQ
jgi:hypothetical protein